MAARNCGLPVLHDGRYFVISLKVICKNFNRKSSRLCTSSILNLCAIAIDRYCAIHDPINYAQKRTPKFVCMVILIVSPEFSQITIQLAYSRYGFCRFWYQSPLWLGGTTGIHRSSRTTVNYPPKRLSSSFLPLVHSSSLCWLWSLSTWRYSWVPGRGYERIEVLFIIYLRDERLHSKRAKGGKGGGASELQGNRSDTEYKDTETRSKARGHHPFPSLPSLQTVIS